MVARSGASLALTVCIAAVFLQPGSSETQREAASRDRARPTAPQPFRVLRTTTTSIVVTWGAASDNVRVTRYRVFQSGVPRAALAANRRSYAFTRLSCGARYRLAVQATDAAENVSRRSVLVAATTDCPRPRDPVVAAAGDLCSTPTDCAATAALVDRIDPDRVLTLGDNAYEDGSVSQFMRYYDPNWGRFKAKTSPTPGNHDYHTPAAKGYFEYFAGRAPGEYYSFDLGAWHLVSLNSEISVSSGSPQDAWLRADLAAHPNRCILAYWHKPRFSSGREHGNSSTVANLWRRLEAARADVILVAHEHNYERFARQNADGAADTRGIREFVVGTGGSELYPLGSPIANSEARNSATHGVLELVLHSAGYSWRFVPVAGASFSDSGSGSC